MKIDKDIIESVLCNYTEIDMSMRVKILREIETEAEISKPEREKKPKKQFVAVAITDKDIDNIPLYLVQIDEDVDHNTIIGNIKSATVEHNTTPKGRKFPVETISNAMGDVKRKFLTERGVSVKTKEPIIIIKSTNPIDFSDTEVGDI